MVHFWLGRRLFGWDPTAWHAWHLALHIAATWLGMAVLRRLGGDRWLVGVAGCLFAAHPLAVEVVPAIARDIDLLLAIFLFATLLLRGPAQWLCFALALGAKEAALVALPLLPLIGGAVAWAPLASVAGVWFVLRTVTLGGVGGYGAEPAVGYALSRGLVEPLFPSLSAWITPWNAALLAAPVAAMLWRYRGRIARFAAVLWVAWVLVLGVGGVWQRRSVYGATLAFVLPGALALVEGARRRHAISLAIGGAWLATWLHGSPAVRPYVDWALSAEVGRALADPGAWAGVADGTHVFVIDRPARIDADPRRFRLWTTKRSLNHTPGVYSVEAFLADTAGRTLHFHSTTSISVDGGGGWEATITREGDAVTVSRRPAMRSLDREAPLRLEGDLTITPDERTPSPSVLAIWQPGGFEVVALR
jgi:hypothetical protein